MSKHVNGVAECPLCVEKLKEADSRLASWFVDFVKPKHPSAHISWSYRGKEDQERAFLDGKSRLHFPLSAHNKCDDQGEPCSLALDLFELDFNNYARWSWGYFRKIAEEAAASPHAIKWGGDWSALGDADHFELQLGGESQ